MARNPIASAAQSGWRSAYGWQRPILRVLLWCDRGATGLARVSNEWRKHWDPFSPPGSVQQGLAQIYPDAGKALPIQSENLSSSRRGVTHADNYFPLHDPAAAANTPNPIHRSYKQRPAPPRRLLRILISRPDNPACVGKRGPDKSEQREAPDSSERQSAIPKLLCRTPGAVDALSQ